MPFLADFLQGKNNRPITFFFLTDHLTMKDAQIRQALTEKLRLYAELAECAGVLEDTGTRLHLLLRGDASDLQQGEQLLKGAITDGNTAPHLSCYPLCWMLRLN